MIKTQSDLFHIYTEEEVYKILNEEHDLRKEAIQNTINYYTLAIQQNKNSPCKFERLRIKQLTLELKKLEHKKIVKS